jgi:hypothetical protein
MTTKISNLARDSFEVARLWEGFLKRHTLGQENSIRKVRETRTEIRRLVVRGRRRRIRGRGSRQRR